MAKTAPKADFFHVAPKVLLQAADPIWFDLSVDSKLPQQKELVSENKRTISRS